jgi:hypothetical protein
MVLDAARGVAFVATWTSPTTILTVRASDQAALHTLTLPEGDERVRVLLLDAVRKPGHKVKDVLVIDALAF